MTRAIEAFYQSTDLEVCVPHVKVGVPTPDDGELEGSYSTVTHGIRIGQETRLPLVTTHELCHAAERQNNLGVEPGMPWEPIEDLGLGRGGTARETFAQTCHIGPTAVQLIGATCPDDIDGTEAFEAILSVYTLPAPDFVELDAEWVEQGSVELTGANPALTFASVTITGGLHLSWDHDDGHEAAYVDLWTGEPADTEVAVPKAENPGAPRGLTVQQWAVVDDAEVLVVRADAPNGGRARRVIAQTAQGVARLGCVRDGEQVFAGDGELWSAWVDGGVVRWGRWAGVVGGR